MKLRLFFTASIMFTLCLIGCARNDVNDDTAVRNEVNPGNEKYNIPNHGGPAISGVDVSNQELDRNINKQDIRGTNVRSTTGSKMRVAEEAARKVSDLPEVNHANIIVANHNAYVAAKLKRTARNGLTANIKDTISRTVKLVDPDIDNVYVSVNPDFYERMNRFERDVRKGRPVSGFFDEFTDTIRRVFPDAK
ncbi:MULTISPECIES: YhcN/YlaJ family sporulation lipoprotein [Neobacillus]|uniref:YhcN/YlaJ family sporulation lipoprotein n=1 Tax=Neobacillus rhizophilus TaxID=2833579 RepID=A0A942UBS5_9BACI|nr:MULTISPECIES: YhcN/YlaJ family sporulation lipoprotein [Neobacillus]MBS4216041.1 YhcN/YlaJ family sporulation lipoprotein [Neobacillus rhizophilus]MBU8919965.1 YhcN/YlaJ family sporulation lipoprotein [Bacillus sp. FJAT-29953]